MAEGGGNPELTIRVIGDWSDFDSQLEQRANMADQGVSFGAPGRGLPDPGRVNRSILEDMRSSTDRGQVDAAVMGSLAVSSVGGGGRGRDLVRYTAMARSGGGWRRPPDDPVIDAEWEPSGGGRGRLPPPAQPYSTINIPNGPPVGGGGLPPPGGWGGGGGGALPPPGGGGGGPNGFMGPNFMQGWAQPLPPVQGPGLWARANNWVSQMRNGTFMALMFGAMEVSKALHVSQEADTAAGLSDTLVGAQMETNKGIQGVASGVFGSIAGAALDLTGYGPASANHAAKQAEVTERVQKQAQDTMRRNTDLRAQGEGLLGGKFGKANSDIERQLASETNAARDQINVEKQALINIELNNQDAAKGEAMKTYGGPLGFVIGQFGYSKKIDANVTVARQQALRAAEMRMKAAEAKASDQRKALNREMIGETNMMEISARAEIAEGTGADANQVAVDELKARNAEIERRSSEEKSPQLLEMKRLHAAQEMNAQRKADIARSVELITMGGNLTVAQYSGQNASYEAVRTGQIASGQAALLPLIGDKQRYDLQTAINAQQLQNIDVNFARSTNTQLGHLQTTAIVENIKGDSDRKAIEFATKGFDFEAKKAQIRGRTMADYVQTTNEYNVDMMNAPGGAAGAIIRPAITAAYRAKVANQGATAHAEEEAALSQSLEHRVGMIAAGREAREVTGLRAEGKEKSATAVEIQRNAENQLLQIKGPDAMLLKRLTLSTAINQEREHERNLVWEGLKGTSQGVASGAEIGPGLEGTRPKEEPLTEGLEKTRQSIDELTKQLEKLNSEAGDGGIF
jgi:hypothetical protein